jgi:DNA-binding response OmpR family regulator
MFRILLIEDDINLAENITSQLINEGYSTEVVFNGALVEQVVLQQKFDCIIMDINLPGINGFALCKMIRDHHIKTPVIMLTAYGAVEDKIQGFDCGADDYLTKPFYFKELHARIKVLIKRSSQPDAEKIEIEDLVIDLNKKIVLRNKQLIKLTAKEFEILSVLISAGGNPVSKKEIISKAWDSSLDVNTNTIEVFVNSLRNKIDKGRSIKLIHTRMGFGYYISANEL